MLSQLTFAVHVLIGSVGFQWTVNQYDINHDWLTIAEVSFRDRSNNWAVRCGRRITWSANHRALSFEYVESGKWHGQRYKLQGIETF